MDLTDSRRNGSWTGLALQPSGPISPSQMHALLGASELATSERRTVCPFSNATGLYVILLEWISIASPDFTLLADPRAVFLRQTQGVTSGSCGELRPRLCAPVRDPELASVEHLRL